MHVMLWSPRAVRPLVRDDVPEALSVLAAHPAENVYIAARILESDLSRARGQAMVYAPSSRIEAVCWSAANVVPSVGPVKAAEVFASRVRRQHAQFSSVFGPQSMVEPLWNDLRAFWRPPGDVRRRQQLMVIGPEDPLRVDADPRVRPIDVTEIETFLPAAEAMFTEEIGYRPYQDSTGRMAYKNANFSLLTRQRALGIVEEGRVVFKAEFGSVALGASQVQGVWVAPELRGRGIAAPAMAAVVEYARTWIAPLVSLYVNDYNLAAVHTYERVGFRTVGEFMTVLL